MANHIHFNRFSLLKLVVFIITVSFHSCARIFNSEYTCFKLATDIPDTKVTVLADGESVDCPQSAPATICAPRAKFDLRLRVEAPNLIDTVYIERKLSGTFLIPNYATAYIGYFIDWKSPKRFTYRKYNYLYEKNGDLKISKFIPEKKGQINLDVSYSIGEFKMHETPKGETDFSVSRFSCGVDYYITDHQFLNANAFVFLNNNGGISRYEPATFNNVGGSAVSIRYGHILKRFELMAGFQTSNRHYYQENYYEDFGISFSYDEHWRTYGVSCASFFKVNRWFLLGLAYEPSFISNRNGDYSFSYEHFLVLNLKFRLTDISQY